MLYARRRSPSVTRYSPDITNKHTEINSKMAVDPMELYLSYLSYFVFLKYFGLQWNL